MKVGDLVSVRYRVRRGTDNGKPMWESPLHGFIFQVPKAPDHMWKMWCLETGSAHILAPRLDEIEVVSESR